MQATRFYTILLASFLLSATASAQVFDDGPSDSTLFTTVFDVPGVDLPNLLIFVGGVPGETTQVNISSGGSVVANSFSANAGSEVNISGGSVTGTILTANNGSEINISGGSFSDVGINGSAGSVVNLFGSNFLLDGLSLDGLTAGEAFTILDRDVTLSGLLDDGFDFSFDLNSDDDFSGGGFEPGATLTVTLTAVPEPSSAAILLLGFGLAGMRRMRSAA